MDSELLVSAAPFFLPIAFAAAVYMFLFWHPRRRGEDRRRYFGPLLRSINPWVAIQALFAVLWISGAMALAVVFGRLGRPILEGLALATAVPAALGLAAFGFAVFFLAFPIWHGAPDTTSSPEGEAMRHVALKGKIRFYVLLGTVTLEAALLPLYGAGAMVGAFLVAFVVMLTLQKLYDY